MPPAPTPVPPSTNLLYKDSFSNGKKVTIGDVGGSRDNFVYSDPSHPKLRVLRVGDILPVVTIDGTGDLIIDNGSSPRVYFDIPNKDVTFSAEVNVTGSVKECYLVARTNHQDTNGFGGYYLYLNFQDKKMYFKKEITHALGYSSRLQEKAITFNKGVWYPASITVKNSGSSVVLSADFNGTKITVTDSGQLKGAPYLDQAKWCFLRTNEPNGVRYRNVTIKPAV